MSDWHELEKAALTGDLGSTVRLVSAFRRYRAAAVKLLLSRYRDGECGAVALTSFASDLQDIEEEHSGGGAQCR